MNFQELQDYCRQRVGIVNNQAIQDTELQTMLNLSLGNLDMVLATTYEDYRLTTYLATLGGAANNVGFPNNRIPLPPDFLKLRGVDFGSPGQWVTLYGFGMNERNRYNNPIANMFVPYGNQASRTIRVMDQWIYVEPQNTCTGQYQVWYTPKFMPLVNPTDPLPSYMDTEGWIEYAVASTGVKCYTKLLLNPQGFLQDRQYYEDMVRNGAANRMANGPQCVQNVRNISDTTFPWAGTGFGSGGW